MDTKGHTQLIKSRVPMAEVLKYAPDLRSITSGRGEFQMEFSHYEELPGHLAEKVIRDIKARQSRRAERRRHKGRKEPDGTRLLANSTQRCSIAINAAERCRCASVYCWSFPMASSTTTPVTVCNSSVGSKTEKAGLQQTKTDSSPSRSGGF